MTTTTPLTGSLLDSGCRTTPRTNEYVTEMFQKYGINSYAIYVDHTTVVEELPDLKEYNLIGYFTFDIFLAGKQVSGRKISLLRTDQSPTGIDGWLVASTSRASAFSLAHALKESCHEDQVIVRFYGGQTTEITAYMDLFSGDSETLVYINHYFDRKYRITFPIEVRYTVCEYDGTVRLSGQRIIKPGGLTVFDTRDMNLADFCGYLRVDLEVENLQVRVQPFIHFWADYISEAGMCRNHQSGWAPHPPGTVFNRGYLPLDSNLEACTSIYNENEHEVLVKALLHYTRDGIDEIEERNLEPVPAGQMSLQSISKLFSDIPKNNINAAYVLLTCEHALHRPNYYIGLTDTHKFIDTYHQSGGKACHWAVPSYYFDKKQTERFKEVGMVQAWALDLPILPERFQIDLFMGLSSMTLVDLQEFEAELFDAEGQQIFNEKIAINGNVNLFTNINDWVNEKGITLPNGGMLRLKPPSDIDAVPFNTAVLFGLKHRDFPHFSTSFVGSPDNVNLPFYLQAGNPGSREYQYSPVTVSDHFCPATCSDEYDSLFIVRHSSLMEGYSQYCEYRLDIVDEEGHQYSVQRTVGPQQFDIFWMSEMLDELQLSEAGSNYTLWFKSYGVKIKPYHALYRRSDHAMSLDDGSEGTLQKEPQIGGLGLGQNKVEIFMEILRENKILYMLPSSVRSQLKKMAKQMIAGKKLSRD